MPRGKAKTDEERVEELALQYDLREKAKNDQERVSKKLQDGEVLTKEEKAIVMKMDNDKAKKTTRLTASNLKALTKKGQPICDGSTITLTEIQKNTFVVHFLPTEVYSRMGSLVNSSSSSDDSDGNERKKHRQDRNNRNQPTSKVSISAPQQPKQKLYGGSTPAK